MASSSSAAAFRQRVQQLNFNRQLPVMLIPTLDRRDNLRDLFSISDLEWYPLRLPVPYNQRCIGSSHGWLIFLQSPSLNITLYNPFLFYSQMGTINLPPFLNVLETTEFIGGRDFFPDFYISKAVLSADPLSNPNYTIMVIYGESRRLAYFKSGDETWTYTPGNRPDSFYDLVFFQGHFLAVNFWGELFIVNIEGDQPIATRATDSIVFPLGEHTRRYIVLSESEDTLYQVVRKIFFATGSGGPALFKTRGFVIYKLGLKDGFWKWERLKTIGDRTLFLGDSCSYCLKALPDFPGVRPNSIYFTDDYHHVEAMFDQRYQTNRGVDSGIYIKTGPHRPRTLRFTELPREERFSAIWIIPSV